MYNRNSHVDHEVNILIAQHALEIQYGLPAFELLDTLQKRFRARVTLEGAIAEQQLEKIISDLEQRATIIRYERHDKDGFPDFSIWVKERRKPLLVECKNILTRGYKVETQKTRSSISNPSSRFYDVNYFHILAVCLGKKTGNWNDFVFARARNLARHQRYPNKLAVLHNVPLDGITQWSAELEKLLW